jgi:drug/metabolite transporter (DMT)-like permease
MISVYSMIFYLPLYFWLWSGASLIPLVSGQEVFFLAFYQGVLMGALTLYSLSRTMLLLGAARGAALMALDPVLAAALGYVVLRESPSLIEALAVFVISLGVLIATTTPDRG